MPFLKQPAQIALAVIIKTDPVTSHWPLNQVTIVQTPVSVKGLRSGRAHSRLASSSPTNFSCAGSNLSFLSRIHAIAAA